MFHIPVYLLVATAEKIMFIPTILDKTDGKFSLPPPTKSRTENGVFVLREVTSFIKGGMGVFGVQRKSCLIALG